MTCDDLATVNGQIKAILETVHGSPLEVVLAIAAAMGVTDAATIAKCVGRTTRSVQMAKRASSGETGFAKQASQRNRLRETGFANEAGFADEAKQASPSKEKFSPHTPLSKETTYHPVESSPSTTDRARVASKGFWTTTLNPSGQQGHAGVTFESGHLQLHNGTRQRWLDQFDGDAQRLDLALIEIAGQIQPNSGRPISVQAESLLARKAGDKRDRDRRYAKAVEQAPRTDRKPKKSTMDALYAVIGRPS